MTEPEIVIVAEVSISVLVHATCVNIDVQIDIDGI